MGHDRLPPRLAPHHGHNLGACDADATVPFEGSGARTHTMVEGSVLQVIPGGPHGVNVSHAGEFNTALVTFLKR